MSEPQLADVSALFPAKPQRRFDLVELPIRGVTVRIRSLFAGEVTRYQSSLVNQKNRRMIQSRLENATARLIMLCVVDASGNQILSDAHVKQIVEEWDNADVTCLSEACVRHCGMDSDEFEELAKNSGRVRFDKEKSESGETAAD